MKILGIIPARGGSKRVPQKNIKPLLGKPLIQYTIESALKSKKINSLIVSTDDQQTSNFAKSLGANSPFLRPKEISDDKSPDIEYIRHTLNWFSEEKSEYFDAVVILRPTCPFRTSDLIDDAIQKFQSIECTSLRTVSAIKSKGHPYWSYKPNGDHLETFITGIDIKDFYQSQLLPTCYALNGVVDILKTKNLIKDDLYGSEITYLETSGNQAIDIDTLEDFEWCEFLMRKNYDKASIL